MPRAPSYQTSSPQRIDPASGVSRPAIRRSTVVLPAPDGPNNTITECAPKRQTASAAAISRTAGVALADVDAQFIGHTAQTLRRSP